ncbi:MAG: hypothetical protein ABL874_11095, partial [Sphingopyxis sp.]
YERVCLIKGWQASVEAKAEWYSKIRRAYGNRVEAMREELDVIPREGEGVLLPLAWIEACSTPDYKVARWEPPYPGFVDMAEHIRRAEMLTWLEREVKPVLARYADLPFTWSIGGDFAMRQDRSAYPIGYVAQDLKRHVPMIVELRQCPYDQQKQTLFWMTEQVKRFGCGVLDANGNGMVLAQEARQRFGPERIVELMPSDKWLREHSPLFRAAFEDKMILVPADLDVRNDLRQIRVVGGVGKVPRDVRENGTDGGKRHADTAVGLMNFHAATMRDYMSYAYQPVASAGRGFGNGDDEDNLRDWSRPPLGARLRTGGV